MEKFQEAREKARRNLQIADHMLYMTYGLVQDPKLLMAVMENVFLALTNAMSSVLHYEKLFKRIPPFPENFEAKYSLFKEKCASRYSVDDKYLNIIRDVKDIIAEHRKSPVEFVRKDRFVICSDNYRMKTISVEQIKQYISTTKAFLQEANNIVSKDERIFAQGN
jgi:hypothetical protein